MSQEASQAVQVAEKESKKCKKKRDLDDGDDEDNNNGILVNYDDYLVEYAKSNRSKCVSCEQKIDKDTVRLGKLDYDAETPYKGGPVPRWHHVDCFVKCMEQLEFFGRVDKIKNFRDLEKEDRDMLREKVKPIKPKVEEANGKRAKTETKEIGSQEEEDEYKFYEEKQQQRQSPQRHQQQHGSPTTNRMPEIDSQSRNCLEPGRMLNDTIVEFYLNYLLEKQPKVMKDRFHLFSTFFYSRIKTLQNSTKGMDSNQSILRWDRHVKIFDKDYMVIPICDCKHWILVVVCFAHKLPTQGDPCVIDESRSTACSACLLIFDSLGYKYLTKFTDPIRNFLNLRWQYERPSEGVRDFKDRKLFREISTKVPRQMNTYDCGIYLLHYFEKFLATPLVTYTQIKNCKELYQEWAMDPKQKRNSIKYLLLLHTQSTSTST